MFTSLEPVGGARAQPAGDRRRAARPRCADPGHPARSRSIRRRSAAASARRRSSLVHPGARRRSARALRRRDRAAARRTIPGVVNVQTDLLLNKPQLEVADRPRPRQRPRRLGARRSRRRSRSCSAASTSRPSSSSGETYDVIAQLERDERARPARPLRPLRARRDGQLVPLALGRRACARRWRRAACRTSTACARRRSPASLAPGVPLGERARPHRARIAEEVLADDAGLPRHASRASRRSSTSRATRSPSRTSSRVRHHLPGAGGAVRELRAPAHDPRRRRALVHRRARRARRRRQHAEPLQPDRPRHAGRPRHEELDPDRRVREPAPRAGPRPDRARRSRRRSPASARSS